jgi:hypothetical protein
MTTKHEPGTVWLLQWATSVDGMEPPKTIGYTDDRKVADELIQRARANPYANARVLDAKPIKMEDLPR